MQTAPTPLICLRPAPKIAGLPAIASGNTLVKDNTITAPTELVHGLLHMATKAVLAGCSKVGKTWILLYLALCVATGTKFFHWSTTKGKVLYINLEIPTPFMKDRIIALMIKLGIKDIGDLEVWNLRGKTSHIEALIANIIKEAEGRSYSLIVIDPIYKLLANKSESSAASVALVCSMLERLAEKTGAAVIFAGHFAKGNAKKKTVIDRMAGSGVWARDFDTLLTITEHSEPDCYTVEMVLRNLPKQDSFVVEWEFPLMVVREDLDPEDVVIEDVEDEDDHGLLEIIKVRPHSTAEWQVRALAMGISRATFFRIKRKLKDMGHVNFDFATKTWRLLKPIGTEGTETRETNETQNPPAFQNQATTESAKA